MANNLNVISAATDNGTLVVRSVVQNFNAGSQLIVHEEQEAIFFKNGKALDLFTAENSPYPLKSSNMPLLTRIFGKVFGGSTPFTCEVYFVNKGISFDILWGTDGPIVLQDPKSGLVVNVRANGQSGIRITDTRRFIVNVVGQRQSLGMPEIKRDIKGMLVSSVKECISQAFTEEGISILEITSHLSSLEEKISKKLNKKMTELVGLSVTGFSIGGIVPDPEDIEKLRYVNARRLDSMMRAQDDVYEMNLKGYTYQEERKFDILEEAAKNKGMAGSFLNMGMGLGIGAGVGREAGRMVGGAMAEEGRAPAKLCPKCSSPVAPDAKFCASCGNKLEEQPSFCTECGSKCPAGSRFCPSCGHSLS